MATNPRKNTQSASWLLSLGVILLIGAFMYLLWQYRNQDLQHTLPGFTIPEITADYKQLLPSNTPKWQVIEHTGYTLAYNEEKEQPAWVAYVLTDSMVLFGKANRRDYFNADPAVTTGSAALQDYKGSGYSRGHLAPAADMKWSTTAMQESFYMSNMSPQLQEFNGGIWRVLEEKIRDWAVSEERLIVVTGPVFKNSTKTIGGNEVGVPDYFYKVVMDVSPPHYKAIGFIMKHEKGTKELYEYAVTVDEVEDFTGLDFFEALPDSSEQLLEQNVQLELWNF